MAGQGPLFCIPGKPADLITGNIRLGNRLQLYRRTERSGGGSPETADKTESGTEGRTVWPHCILIDEAEFLTAQQVVDLANIVDTYNIPIICYGLRTDFQCNLFEGSKTLFEVADKLEEIKTVCQWCDHKATMNLRMVDGSPVYDGNQIQIGDQEYISVCRYHYTNPVIKVTKNKKEKEV